jgi:hypothetical protein
MAEQGYPAEAAAIAAAWGRGDREAAERAASNELIEETSIAGTPEQCRARIEAYRQSGIDVPIVSLFARASTIQSGRGRPRRSREGGLNGAKSSRFGTWSTSVPVSPLPTLSNGCGTL